MSRKGGVLSGGFQPLKAPNAPTVDSVSAGVLSASVTVSAPANTGDGTVSGYVVTAKQSDGSLATGTASSAGAVSVTLTAGGTTEFAAQAFSEYGPGQFSGFGNSTAVPTGQELYTWGRGSQGRLGHNDIIDRSSPTQVGALTTWYQVALGGANVGAIKTDGTFWTWGSNSYGRLAQNNTTDVSSPTQVGALTNWSQVSGGNTHMLAVKTDGTLWSWGNDFNGRLGLNQPDTDKSSPTQVGSLTTWSKVSGGSLCSIAIKADGTLWSWGRAYYGQLGQNNIIDRSSPVQVGASTDWYQISAGSGFCGAVKTDGTLWMWGNGNVGKLGLNLSSGNRSSPVQVGALTNWAQVQTCSSFTTAVKTDGTLWVWGAASNGRTGTNNLTTYSSPVQIGALTDWAQVTTLNAGAAAIKTDGTLWAWGFSDFGQVGDSTTITRSSPVQVGALTSWYQVSGNFQNPVLAAIQQSFT